MKIIGEGLNILSALARPEKWADQRCSKVGGTKTHEVHKGKKVGGYMLRGCQFDSHPIHFKQHRASC